MLTKAMQIGVEKAAKDAVIHKENAQMGTQTLHNG